MYYRLTTAKFNPSNRKAVLNFADSVREEMNKFEGLHYARTIEVADGHHVTIQCYESEEASEKAMPRVLEVMSKGAHLFSEPPSRIAGDIVWEI